MTRPARLATSVGMTVVPVGWLVAVAAGLTAWAAAAVALGAYVLVLALLAVWAMLR